MVDNRQFQLFTSPVCLAIAFYFSEKSGCELAKRKISLLTHKMNVAIHEKKDILLALDNKRINDFEDGLEYYAAANAGCKCIVTENVEDFHFSDIEVLCSEDFLMRYLIKNK